MKKNIYLLAALLILSCQFLAAQNFITRWDLATAGSGATQLSFGVATAGTVNYTWQEISPGTATGSGTFAGTTCAITGLPAGAVIRLQIAPANFQRININNGTDRNRLTQVEQWGSTAWTSMQNAFNGCANMQVTATDVPNLAGVTNMSSMFKQCTGLNSPANINTWNTAGVTTMANIFYGASAFNQNIGSWNTGGVTDMSYMFYYAIAFNQNIGSWNTGQVTDMNSMFYNATAFNQNIGPWNTGQVTIMTSMLQLAGAFNQNIGSWTLRPGVVLISMLHYCGMDCHNYSATLTGWNANAGTPTGLSLGASAIKYTSAASAARANLVLATGSGGKGWTINDGGLIAAAQPTFTAAPAICSGSTLAPLPTTSGNGITGTWSPALNNTATTNYTFTPTAGQCALTQTLNITVNPNVTPTFTAAPAICSGGTLSPLPTTSGNGITGAWNPSLNNTTTQTYTFTPAAGQCALTHTFTVLVNPLPDVTTSQLANVITVSETGAAYQWINCGSGNSVISGATAQSYTATATGSYAVIVSKASCTNTSTCVTITSTGIAAEQARFSCSIYPNPAQTVLNIKTDALITSALIYSLWGELVQTETTSAFSIAGLTRGIYILHINSKQGSTQVRFMKE